MSHKLAEGPDPEHFDRPRLSRLSAPNVLSVPVLGGWELLRVLGFVDVSLAQANPEDRFFGAGLAAFFMVSIALLTAHPATPYTMPLVKGRIARFAGAWLLWSAVYFIADVIISVRHGQGAFEWLSEDHLLVGVAPHLWFLVATLGLVVSAHLLDRFTKRVPDAAFVAAGAVLAALAFYVGSTFDKLDTLIWQYLSPLPALPLGLAAGRVVASSMVPRVQSMRLGMFTGLVLLSATPVVLLQPHAFGLCLRYVMALSAMALLLIPFRILAPARKLRGLALVALALQPIVGIQIAHRLTHAFELPAWAHAVIATVLTLAVAWAFNRSRLMARLHGG